MKLLFRKEQDEILKRIIACQIICGKYVEDIESFVKMTENLSKISLIIGGESGTAKVNMTLDNYYK